jgi:hypothetical protein
MSVTYHLNWMGPITIGWYKERGLTRTVERVCESDKILNLQIGDVYEVEEVTTHYSAGRIDIRDSSKEGYHGWREYAVAPMVNEDWILLSNWLLDLETTKVWDYDMLISIFEGEVLNGRKIRWWNDE